MAQEFVRGFQSLWTSRCRRLYYRGTAAGIGIHFPIKRIYRTSHYLKLSKIYTSAETATVYLPYGAELQLALVEERNPESHPFVSAYNVYAVEDVLPPY